MTPGRTRRAPAPLRLRPVLADDLPLLRTWLRPGAATHLPGDATAGAMAAIDPGEQWLLVAGADGPLACARLRRAIGLQLPRPWYHLGCVVHAAPELQLFHRQHTLQLGHDHTGASELADIAWQAEGRSPGQQTAALQALVAGALACVAAHRADFAPRLIVELPGPRDAEGRSPFWHGLGRHFYADDPVEAARRFGPAWRSHVAALLPRQPVYCAFLPAAARQAIGQVAADARVLLDVLWQAGLRHGHHVTVDDGGPVFEADLDLITALASGPRG